MTGTEAYAAFNFWGFSCDPDVISETLGLQPTTSWRIGDVVGAVIAPRKVNFWKLTSGLGVEHSIKEHVNALVLRLAGAKDALIGLHFGGTSVVVCALYVDDDDRPAVHVTHDALRFIADIGAAFDLDIYHLGPE